MPRSSNFTLNNLPEASRSAWGAIRDFTQRVAKLQRDAAPKHAAIEGDRDLLDRARVRRLGELRTEVESSVLEALAHAEGEVRTAQGKLRALAQSMSSADPVQDAIREAAEQPAARALAKLLGGIFQLQARAEVDRRIEAALASEAREVTLPRVAEALAGDPLLGGVLERVGRARVELEGSTSLLQAFDAVLEAHREERMPDGARLALDHADALEAAVSMAQAVVADVQAPDGAFYRGRAIALDAMRESHPQLLGSAA